MVKSGQPWTGLIVTKDATGELATPSVGPAGVLYVDGTADAASVTVSGTNPYKWAVTLPTLTAGQSVSMYITATIATVTTGAVVAEDQADTARMSDALTAQETANAVHNLAPAGTPAANSIGDKLNDMPATILTTAVAAYAGTPGTFGYLLSLLAGLDFTAVNLVATSNAGEITIKRTLNLVAVVSGLTIPADWTACYWTVKRSTDDPDAEALVQILESNPGDGDDGVQVLAGEAVEDGSDGSLTVNQAGGTVAIVLGDASTALLEDAVELVWDVKVHAPAGKTQPGAGTASIATAVTRA